MKKLLTNIVLLLTFGITHADIPEIYTYALDDYVEDVCELPIVRKINGGTKINVTYEGAWTNEMKGAFEYACKIWEEALPTAIPLNITAKIGNIRVSSGPQPISKVSPIGHHMCDGINDGDLSLRPQIKYVVLREFQYDWNRQFTKVIADSTFFNDADIIITYNRSRLKEFSYNLDAVPQNKYDFVTLVLRDIAKGLGISCDCYVVDNKLIFRNECLTKFERQIWGAIYDQSPEQMLVNATAGQVNAAGLHIYAPSNWSQGLSLNSLIPSEDSPLSKLLAYNLSKGTVIRNVEPELIPDFFRGYMGWYPETTVSSGSDIQNTTFDGNTNKFIPFGSSSFLPDFNGSNLASHNGWQTKVLNSQDNDSIVPHDITCPCFNEPDFEDYQFEYQLSDYIWKYENCFQSKYPRGDKKTHATIVSLLKKDGSWDDVYMGAEPLLGVPINTADFEYHETIDKYARSPDGYLKCRIVYNQPYSYQGTYRHNCQVLYYVMDCKPQIIEMAYSGLDSDFSVSQPESRISEPDEYLRDVRIGIKNLEGATRIVVDQLDEFDYVPISYEVSDFKKGYFVATVDKEFSSSFTITAYNSNGCTRSETFTLPALEPWDGNAAFSITNNSISLTGNALRARSQKDFKYEISSISTFNVQAQKSGKINFDSTIDISDLPSGLYVITLYRDGKKHTTKFEKK